MEINFDVSKIKTPCYVIDEKLLIKNLEILKEVSRKAGCKILLAQKAFSMYSLYPLIGQYLDGTTASGLYEARLGREEMGKETHIFSAAYTEEEFAEILDTCDHIIFNSFSQWKKYKGQALTSGKEFGIRINPECSTQDQAIYDPCSPGSRLGVIKEKFESENLTGISGLHFHTLCEQNSDALVETVKAVEEKFGTYLSQMKWINFGGGHHITRSDYDIDTLIECIIRFREKYDVMVYLEPGEAVALNSGFLVSKVLDVVENQISTAILDVSAACHMPDVLEMPYRPHIFGADEKDELAYTYRLGGSTCLAGDIIGDYSFVHPLRVGDSVVFGDMAIYTMVKNNTFNGMKLPSIAVYTKDGRIKIIKQFGYEDFKSRI